jgi:hypothetical protein
VKVSTEGGALHSTAFATSFKLWDKKETKSSQDDTNNLRAYNDYHSIKLLSFLPQWTGLSIPVESSFHMQSHNCSHNRWA